MWEIKKSSEHDFAPPKKVNWPWSRMEPGDLVTIEDQGMAGRAQVICHVYGRQNNRKFKTKTIDGVLHVWRIS